MSVRQRLSEETIALQGIMGVIKLLVIRWLSFSLSFPLCPLLLTDCCLTHLLSSPTKQVPVEETLHKCITTRQLEILKN